MCEVLTAAEDAYFKHVCNYSMSDLVNGCHGTQHLALIPSNCVKARNHNMLGTDIDYIIKGGGGGGGSGSSSSIAGCVKLAAYCRA